MFILHNISHAGEKATFPGGDSCLYRSAFCDQLFIGSAKRQARLKRGNSMLYFCICTRRFCSWKIHGVNHKSLVKMACPGCGIWDGEWVRSFMRIPGGDPFPPQPRWTGTSLVAGKKRLQKQLLKTFFLENIALHKVIFGYKIPIRTFLSSSSQRQHLQDLCFWVFSSWDVLLLCIFFQSMKHPTLIKGRLWWTQ